MIILLFLIVIFTGTAAAMNPERKEKSPKRPQYFHADVTQPCNSHDVMTLVVLIKKMCQKLQGASSSAPKAKNKIKDD